jgi:type II secretory pathway component PulF
LDAIERPKFLPQVVPASLQMGSEQSDLVNTTEMLANMYREQSEVRLATLPAILSPLLLFVVAICVCTAVVAALLPMLIILQQLSGPKF